MRINTKKIIAAFLLSLLLIFIAIFFSHRLLEVPRGLTSDEAAFGYNAALLAKTGTDQNGRFLPLFVLSLEGKDWRQPVTQYYMTALFKIFGPSVFLLRFSSILITIISAVLLFYISTKLLSLKWAILSCFIFLTTPLVMIQSHMGLDNIMPIPFTIIWLAGIFAFTKTGNRKYLILAAMSLGINFYTYKAMRAAVPIWILLTVAYLFINQYHDSWKKTFKNSIKDILIFCFYAMPFFAIIPLLQRLYPGAVFSGQRPSFDSVYAVIFPYLSSFDPTFLFVTGDSTMFHSTQKHGMMLLASAPLFFSGLYYALKKKGFWMFILISFFTAPLLFGLVGSAHRASRLMMMIPSYCLLASLGAKMLWENHPKIYFRSGLGVVAILMVINYADFVNYYWTTYPKITENIFSDLGTHTSYKKLAEESELRNLTPYLDEDIYKGDGDSGHFFETIYFETAPQRLDPNEALPQGGILMTRRENIPEATRLPAEIDHILHIRE